MKWLIFLLTILFETSVVWGVTFMHHVYAIIAFLGVSLFVVVVLQESREDMQERPKKILSGVMLGTYASTAVISLLVYQKLILL